MTHFDSKSYLRWVKEYIKINKGKIPQIITANQYSRQKDREYYQRLKSLAQKFTKTYSLHAITNELSEQKKFFRALYENRIYNPVFHYKKSSPLTFDKASALVKKLNAFRREVESDESALGQIYQRRIFDAEKAIILNSLSQKKGFSLASREYYEFKKIKHSGLPAKLSFPCNKQEIIEAYETVYFAQKILSKLGLKHRAKISTIDSRLQGIITSRKNIKVGIGTLRSPARIIRSLAHEVLGHALISTNARKYPAFFARHNSSASVRKEEGIAVKIGELAYQELQKFLTPQARSHRESLIPHLRLKAILLARKKSFYQTFIALTKLNINNDLAWDLTLRAKRGLWSSAVRGANYHDSLYFFGLKEINTLIKRENLDLKQTFILLDHLSQGKFDLVEFTFLKQHFINYKNISLISAFDIFKKELTKIIQSKFIK